VDTSAPAPPDVATPARRPRVSLWLLRGILAVHLVAVLCQPVLAGLFLSGDVAAIEIHGVIGTVMGLLTLVALGAAVAYVIAGRGRLWVLPVGVVLLLAEGAQIGLGYAHELQLHIPLGVAIVVASVLLAIWAWTPSAAAPRRGRS
jgi:hypothetical protein